MRLPDPKGVECSRFIGVRTSGVLTLRRARAAHHAVCTRAPVSVQARALLEPCVARGRPIMLCVRVSVQARAQHIRRSHHPPLSSAWVCCVLSRPLYTR